ncbi:hypothetical protein SKAU_G00400400 [Synaphobranchus kaupii]|uniref:Uncharacterized protein n=1 Tax=Synaphobranchus kaupii TaxID=118154 RepID=A0A9Q1E903_SYNKA|nr:hypothetical protein SKAU_G00400400 [Synaphobranchus kaupii]
METSGAEQRPPRVRLGDILLVSEPRDEQHYRRGGRAERGVLSTYPPDYRHIHGPSEEGSVVAPKRSTADAGPKACRHRSFQTPG